MFKKQRWILSTIGGAACCVFATCVVIHRLREARHDAAVAQNLNRIAHDLEHGRPLKGQPVRLSITDFELESKDLRIARIRRDPRKIESATRFIEGTTDSMDFAFRAYLSELADGVPDTGFWYSSRGVSGEQIKLITIASGGREESTFYTIDAVSLPELPR